MDWIYGIIIGAILGAILHRALQAQGKTTPVRLREAPSPGGEAVEDNPLPALGEQMREFYDASAHPTQLFEHPAFGNGVEWLSNPVRPLPFLIDSFRGNNQAIAAMAAEALARRADSAAATGAVIEHLPFVNVWTTFFALRFLGANPDHDVIFRVLGQEHEGWRGNPVLLQALGGCIAARLEAGEKPDPQAAVDANPALNPAASRALLAAVGTPEARRIIEALEAWLASRVDAPYLNSVGRIWRRDEDAPTIVEHEALSGALAAARAVVEHVPPGSLVISGESGAGKTSLVRLLARRLMDEGWAVFEAGAAEVISGQVYIGELEGRIRDLLANLESSRRILWYAPNFDQFYHSGRHRFSPLGVLDLLLPAIEAGRVCLVGEITPSALQKLIKERPRVRHAFTILRLESLAGPETLELASCVARDDFAARGVTVEPAVLREALDLSRHFFAGSGQPGAMLRLLRETCQRVANEEARSMTRQDLLATVAQLTGLSQALLDEREGLDTGALRAFFQSRIMGQPEAIDCLVDRVAMLKAGLTDPRRPIGVFLFAGPTGTGKTEVAKTLAEFLFGAQERMVRLDMSEFREPQSMPRLVGGLMEGQEVEALVDKVRKQPFSVLLLDEFEKADARVWDLFLQVFDDGRLTDAHGNLADFRYCIIILTSNLGATEHFGTSLGFRPRSDVFSEAQLMRVVRQTFRPEFINRLDRVVVFRPLSRAVMREILKKELNDVLQRRGFRNKEWAVEWEESAIEYLLDRGFTADLGARPLRRAIEEHVLAPVALTIVEHRFPEGDQFLFVKSDGRAIQVEFVDPDAEPPAPRAAPPEAPTLITLSRLILAPSGDEAERRFLADALEELERKLLAAGWVDTKELLLRDMGRDGFWEDPDRFGVLGKIESMDRIEAGAGRARSFARRLAPRPGRQRSAPAAIVSSLAQQLYLLGAALRDVENGTPSDAFVSIEPVAGDAAAPWPGTLAAMYQEWVRKRGLRATLLSDAPRRDRAPRIVLAVSGLGAYDILRREQGLHVLEVPEEERSFDRHSVRVRVVPQPLVPRPAHQSELEYALAALAATGEGANVVVRRYREQPSPLVRDALAGWRTGKLEQVLGGDFDIIS